MIRLLGTATIAAILTTLTLAHAQVSADALLDVSPAWEMHFNAGDLDALATLYMSDAVLLPPNMPALQGHDALRALAQAYLDAGAVRSSVPQVEDYDVTGDTAWASGAYTFFDADGNVVDIGKYLVVYRIEAGAWRIARHGWSSDLPPFAAAD